MLAYVLRRLAAAVPVVFGITIVAFLLIHLVPGDPAKVILFGTNATPAQLANLRRQLGLDDPLWRQYVSFVSQLLHGDLATSYLTQNSVAHELLSRTPSTLELTGAAMVVAIAIGVPLGMLGARSRTRWLTGRPGQSPSSGWRCRTSSSPCCLCCCSACGCTGCLPSTTGRSAA